MPSESELTATTASIPRWPIRTTTDCTSLSCSGRSQWGSYRISYTYSKALDNVGEFFFSAPINNFNIWQDYGRSDDDQRQSPGVRRHDPFADEQGATPPGSASATAFN